MDFGLEAGGEEHMRKETTYTTISPATRRHVYDRDKGCCVLCSTVGGLQCAHYIPRSQGGLGREQNLIMLCPECHRLYDQSHERRQLRKELRGYLKSKYPDWNEKNLIYRKELSNAE